MFNIFADTIEFHGRPIARFLPGIGYSLREDASDELSLADGGKALEKAHGEAIDELIREHDERPFRFEDLAGREEPKDWGPKYPELPSLEKFRRLNRVRELTAEEESAYGAATHEAFRKINAPARRGAISLACTAFNAKRHRAHMLAQLHAAAAQDRRQWASGETESPCSHLKIGEAYAHAMAQKREVAALLS